MLTENFLGKKQKIISKIKKEMESLAIRKLSIYEPNTTSPQDLLTGIAKILLKVIMINPLDHKRVRQIEVFF